MPTLDISLDTMVPAQFFSRRGDLAQPEKRLLAAVLEDAIRTFQSLHGARRFRGRRLFREAELWFASDRTDDVFTYVRVCQALAIDPDWLREGLRRWRAAREEAIYQLPSITDAPDVATAAKRQSAA